MDLLQKVLEQLGWLPWAAPALIAVGLAWRADAALPEEGRKQVEDYIWHRNRIRKASRTMGTFSAALNAVFGEKHWTVRCFRRSCLASLAALAILTLPSRFALPNHFLAAHEWRVTGEYWALYIWASFVPDFLSLWQTRWFVRWAERTGSTIGIVGIILGDLVASTAISVTLSLAAMVVWMGGIPALRSWSVFRLTLEVILEVLKPLHVPPHRTLFTIGHTMWDMPHTPAVLSGLLTSVWLWIYALGTLLARGLLRLEGPMRGFRRLFSKGDPSTNADAMTMPFTATALVGSAGYLVIVAIGWLVWRLLA